MVVTVVGAFSCADDNSQPNPPTQDTVLMLTASKSSVLNDSVDFAKLTVKYGPNDVTSSSSIIFNDKELEGDVFRSQVAGVYEFKALYNGKTSNIVTIVAEPPAVRFVHNLAVFDVTSTYCIYCPIGGGTIQQARVSYAPKVMPFYFHVDQSTPKDPFEMSQSKDMMRWLGGYSYPMIRFNNKVTVGGTSMQLTDFVPYISGDNETARAGVAIDTKYDEQTKELTIDFRTIISDIRYADQDLRLVGWYTEDSLVSPQASPSTVIKDYVHNDVVREVLVDSTLLGISIPTTNLRDGKEFVYRKVLKMDKGWQPKQSYISGYIYHKKGRATPFDTLLNVQRVAFGKSIDYQRIN